MANRIAVAQNKNGAARKSSDAQSSRSQSTNTYDEIAKLAYQFFVERGCQHGHDREDWLRAESVINKRKF